MVDKGRTHVSIVAAIVTPNEADAQLAGEFLATAGIVLTWCRRLADLGTIEQDRLGCVLLVEEALADPEIESFRHGLEDQPAWSDMPILLVAAADSALSSRLGEIFPGASNVVLLQRPLPPWSVVSAVRVALRSRQRQFQVRELLEERGRAVKQRDEFLAMLAHELRNPLAPIRNAVHVMGAIDLDNPILAECRQIIDKQARHMTRLVEDLVDASRFELGKAELRLQSLDLNDCIVSAAATCRPITGSHRHRVTITIAPEALFVMADPVRVEQAISNLIVNAAKFTPDGGSIAIDSARDGDAAVVRVTDSGVGIRPEMLDSIFELFTQGQATLARTEGGLGIGLTLVKRLAEQHGGTVSASSDGPGTGSRFELRLPLAVASQAAAQAGHAAGAGTGVSRHVLIVEDLEDVRNALALLVRTWKHDVSFAVDGLEGITKARASQPDVMLIDIGLPGLDGYEVARSIRRGAGRWAREVKLIAITGYGQASDRDRAIAAGFDVHMVKPVDPAELGKQIG